MAATSDLRPFERRCRFRRASAAVMPDDAVAARAIEPQPAIIRILPHGQSRTGRAPGIHPFLPAAIPFRQPLEKIEDQALYYQSSHACPSVGRFRSSSRNHYASMARAAPSAYPLIFAASRPAGPPYQHF